MEHTSGNWFAHHAEGIFVWTVTIASVAIAMYIVIFRS